MSSANTQIIFIHGINAQSSGYSTRLFNAIQEDYLKQLAGPGMDNQTLQETAARLVQKEIIWADVTLDLTNRYTELEYELYGRKKGIWNIFTKKIDPLVLQILFYVKDKGDKESGRMSILQRIDERFREITAEGKDLVVVAHSLGSVIAFDYLFGFRKFRADPDWTIKALITLGSPVPLFISAMGHTDSDIRLPDNLKGWYNLYDPDDGVARRCKPFFSNIDLKDISVNTGFFPVEAHRKYWDGKNTSWEIAKILRQTI
ncbi:MAG: hypothetical protein AB7S78_02825 [Candidatus Omnitrophota bacterium]